MNANDYVQLIFYVGCLIFLTPPLGRFIAKVFEGEKTWLHKPFGWVERLIYKISGIDQNVEMSAREYGWALMVFNIFGILIVFLFQILQAYLPFNPQNLPNVSWHSAINTAVSFVTNTNWQGYAGETTMSYLTQMAALTVQNFLSAAVGLSVAIALTRGIARRNSFTIGNYWVDMTRSIVYILLPFSIIFALFLVGQGVVQTFAAYVDV
ncbi:MAG: potassium-transporting ATPase subunit KdpA, partial [Bacteriovoracales bacterium]